jgi:diaminopimelate decarboxylase
MADIALVTANKVEIVESIEQMTLPTDEAVTAGMAVRINTTTGKFTKSNGSAAGEARIYGIATKTVASGMPVTAVRKGVMDGWDLSGLAYDAVVYLSDTDGRLGDAAGTVSTVVGRVIPGTSEALGTAFSKLLLVDL